MTPDLIERLREIERRAASARRDIQIGREQGLNLNGSTALGKIEKLAGDGVRELERENEHA